MLPGMTGPFCVLAGFYPQECTIVLRGQNVKQTIRAFPYIADPLFQFHQHWLSTQLLPAVVEHHALQLPGPGNAAFP